MAKTRNRNHLTWSVETPGGKCPKCNTKTILIIAPLNWNIDDDGDNIDNDGDVEVRDEVTGHFCPQCERLRSLSLNTLE